MKSFHGPTSPGGTPTTKSASSTATATGRISEVLNEHAAEISRLRGEQAILRAESQALRRCLLDAGVLSTEVIQEEVARQQAKEEPNSPVMSVASTAASRKPLRKTVVENGVAGKGGLAGKGSGPRAPMHAEDRIMSLGQPRENTPTPRGRGGDAAGDRAASRSASGSPLRARASNNAPVRDIYKLVQPWLNSANGPDREQALSRIAQALRNGAGPCRWQGPETPLRSAVQGRWPGLVTMLLQARANPNEADAKGVCILHTAAFDGQTDLVRFLLESQANPNACDRHGQTPLFFAPIRSVCEVLVQHRAEVNVVNPKGQTALHLAGRAGLGDVLVWLNGHVSKHLVEARDMHGATAAYYARHAGIQPSTLMKNRITTFDAPAPAAGRSALSDHPGPPTTQCSLPSRPAASGSHESSDPEVYVGEGVGNLPPLIEEDTGESKATQPTSSGDQIVEPLSVNPQEMKAATKIQAVARGSQVRTNRSKQTESSPPRSMPVADDAVLPAATASQHIETETVESGVEADGTTFDSQLVSKPVADEPVISAGAAQHIEVETAASGVEAEATPQEVNVTESAVAKQDADES